MAIIFYASETKLTDEHVPVVVKGWRGGRDPNSPKVDRTVYVRALLDEDAWPGPAMNSAKPMSGEVALNAVPNSVVIKPKS